LVELHGRAWKAAPARWDFNGLTHKFVPRLTDIMRIET
jgi:hypothetical protein